LAALRKMTLQACPHVEERERRKRLREEESQREDAKVHAYIKKVALQKRPGEKMNEEVACG